MNARRHVARFDVAAAVAGTLRAIEHVASRNPVNTALPAPALNATSVGRR
jgi:hypothetical protein